MEVKKFAVRESARKLAHYRWVEGQLMELMGGWAYTVPEAEVKVKFGYWLHEDAQHSRKMLARLPELMSRSEKRQKLAPSDAFVRACEEIWLASDTLHRLSGLVLLKNLLAAAYTEHLSHTDSPPDEPTERIIREVLLEEREHIAWCEARLQKLPVGDKARQQAVSWRHELQQEILAAGAVYGNEIPATCTFKKTFAYSKAPVRDDRWTIVEKAQDYGEKNHSFGDATGKLHLLHDLLNSEYITVERVGKIIAEFPEIPFEMKLDMARQAWDEARHAEIIQQRLEELGGTVGMFPVNFWGWEMDVNYPDPLGRLALSNATFESESCKHVKTWISRAQETGDPRSVHVLEYILADEVTHVQFGTKWIDKLTADDPARRERVLGYARQCVEENEHPTGIKFDETNEARQLRS